VRVEAGTRVGKLTVTAVDGPRVTATCDCGRTVTRDRLYLQSIGSGRLLDTVARCRVCQSASNNEKKGETLPRRRSTRVQYQRAPEPEYVPLTQRDDWESVVDAWDREGGS
jgi:hypothetical protein